MKTTFKKGDIIEVQQTINVGDLYPDRLLVGHKYKICSKSPSKNNALLFDLETNKFINVPHKSLHHYNRIFKMYKEFKKPQSKYGVYDKDNFLIRNIKSLNLARKIAKKNVDSRLFLLKPSKKSLSGWKIDREISKKRYVKKGKGKIKL